MSPNNKTNTFDEEVENLLENVAKDKGLTDYQIKKAGGSMKGDGYLGVITAIELSGTNGSEKKKFELVVKTASKSAALREGAPIADVFQREIYMYNTVIPCFQKFQRQKSETLFNSFAKCYTATVIDQSEALVLENLRSKGFRLWERRVPMNEEHVTLVMREYGRLHALSFALRDQNLEKFRKLTRPMSDVFIKFFEKSDFIKTFENLCYKASEALDKDEDAKSLQVFKRFVGNLDQFIIGLPELVDRYSVILHGDCWTNNMMFGYDDIKNPDTPTKMCFIDLQLARLGPPVLDLAYYFYACSSKDIVSNFQHYLDIYYNSFSEYLRKLGSDPEDLYPCSVFCRQWKESSRFGLVMSIFIIKLMLSEQNEVADLSEVADSGKCVSDGFDYAISKVDEYNDRVKHIILHFVNNKFI